MLIAPGVCFCSPRGPITTGIVSVFIPHILIVAVYRSLCLESFSVVFSEVFLSEATARSMNLQVLLLWSLITISGLLSACVYLHIPKYCSFFIFSDRCWLMNTFSSHCFHSSSWALCFVFSFILFEYMVLSSFSHFFRFGTSSSCLNVSPSFWKEYNFFLFSRCHTSWSRVSPEYFKHVSNPTVIVL